MTIYPTAYETKKYYFTDTSFDNFIKKRIHHVLLILSKYDAFLLEEDGKIDEQIFDEYASLNLRYSPQFIQVSTAEKAIETKHRFNYCNAKH